MTTSFTAIKEVALSRMLKVFDTAFADRPIDVDVELEKGSSSAQTDLIKIQIKIRDGKPEAPMAKAFNLHELSHILYSPAYHEISYTNIERDIANILEDARIEWIFSHKYPAARKYFVFLVKEVGVTDPILLWGRRFMLPFKVKRPFPDKPRVAEIIDEYVVSTDNMQRFTLVTELASLIGKKAVEYPRDLPPTRNRTAERAESKQAAKQAGKSFNREKKEEKVEELHAEMKEREKEEKKPEEAKKEAEDLAKELVKEIEGISEEEIAEKGKEIAERLEKEAEEAGESIKDEIDKLSEELEKTDKSQAVKDTEESDTRTDIGDAMDEAESSAGKAIADVIAGGGAAPGAKAKASVVDAQEEARSTPLQKTMPDISPGFIQDLSDILSRARLELSGEYIPEQKSGRIDFRALMNPRPRLDVFKKYETSREDEALLSIILYVDISGSMIGNRQRIALDCAYAIASATKQTGSEALVIAFESNPHIIAMPAEIGVRDFGLHGGTEIASAIDLANLLSRDLIYQKINIVITDGEIYDRQALMTLIGISTLNYIILINPQRLARDYEETLKELKQYGTVYELRRMQDLPNLLTSIVDQIMMDKLEMAKATAGGI